MGLELRPVADAGAMGEYMAGKPVPSDTDECGSCQVPECAPPPTKSLGPLLGRQN